MPPNDKDELLLQSYAKAMLSAAPRNVTRQQGDLSFGFGTPTRHGEQRCLEQWTPPGRASLMPAVLLLRQWKTHVEPDMPIET